MKDVFVQPTCNLPSTTATVAGTAPSARTMDTSRAVSRLAGKGMPWATMVDSRPRQAALGKGIRTSSATDSHGDVLIERGL